jgi:hypothetical protein
MHIISYQGDYPSHINQLLLEMTASYKVETA